MKKILALVATVFTLATSAQAQYENTAIKVGQKAPELSLSTPDGKALKLTDVAKGRYVLVDFWASWCGPCRRANPRLVQLYKDYSEKKFKDAKNGFTIFSVSLDKSGDSWKKAIADDNLLWANHVSDLGGWGSKAAEIYGVQFVPQAFLVAPDGKIVGKYMLAEEAELDLKKFVK